MLRSAESDPKTSQETHSQFQTVSQEESESDAACMARTLRRRREGVARVNALIANSRTTPLAPPLN
jgi:hypothetical protein